MSCKIKWSCAIRSLNRLHQLWFAQKSKNKLSSVSQLLNHFYHKSFPTTSIQNMNSAHQYANHIKPKQSPSLLTPSSYPYQDSIQSQPTSSSSEDTMNMNTSSQSLSQRDIRSRWNVRQKIRLSSSQQRYKSRKLSCWRPIRLKWLRRLYNCQWQRVKPGKLNWATKVPKNTRKNVLLPWQNQKFLRREQISKRLNRC